jgi:D-alanyl-D-alanine carboxypeptidase
VLVRGSPPSTLGAQAARLARAGTAARPIPTAIQAPQHLGGPVQSGSGTSIEIQIGAYGSAEEAEAHMAAAQARLSILAGHPALALPEQSGGRLVYRARFSGFDASKAGAACLELKRTGSDCFVARP